MRFHPCHYHTAMRDHHKGVSPGIKAFFYKHIHGCIRSFAESLSGFTLRTLHFTFGVYPFPVFRIVFHFDIVTPLKNPEIHFLYSIHTDFWRIREKNSGSLCSPGQRRCIYQIRIERSTLYGRPPFIRQWYISLPLITLFFIVFGFTMSYEPDKHMLFSSMKVMSAVPVSRAYSPGKVY